jgi:hypothetical protein
MEPMNFLLTGEDMRKRHDSAADLIWKEKLESNAAPWDAVLLVALLLLLLFAI